MQIKIFIPNFFLFFPIFFGEFGTVFVGYIIETISINQLTA